ncbi:MAG: hypothetical protein O2803_13790 [Chloroflexi bacterium]|nr:hypothetical protein [Chloroflexota bacterium]
MKKKWLMIPLATGLLAAGLTGGSVLAHNGDGEQESPKDAVASKVAEALGLDAESVKAALQEATREVRSDRLQHRLDHMVESGRLTEEQATAYLEWYQARPEGPELNGGGYDRFGFGGGAKGEDHDANDDSEGDNNEINNRSGSRSQGNSDRRFPGLGLLPNGRDFPGQGHAYGRPFLGQDSAPSTQEAPDLGSDAPDADDTSF